jgi:ElaB/YqjD/DUF883 family membrane-anchored ribosome-binding protein
MSEHDARTPGADGGLEQVGEELGTTAQQVRRAAAALSGSGRIGPGDAARGAAQAIDRAGAATAGAARVIRRAREAARARPWATVAAGVGVGLGGLLGQVVVRRRRAARQSQPGWGEALERIWITATERPAPPGR